MKSPVFQSLLYEKSCISRYGEKIDCTNISQIYADKDLQSDANHLILISSFCLLIPAIFSSLILGSLSDTWNAKIPMMIPFLGLIIGDMNYLIQTVNIHNNVYYLMISDIIYGCCGAGAAVTATTLSYNIKTTSPEVKSERVAAFEASAGLGITLGYFVSGPIRQYTGYTYYFLILMILHVLGFLYVLSFAEELEAPQENNETTPLLSTVSSHFTQVYNFVKSYKNKPCSKYLLFIIISISVEMLFSSGVDDILFSYLRYKLSWSDKPYGWYNGFGNAISSITVIFLYPYLHRFYHINDVMLAIYGFTGKIIVLLLFAFLFSNWWAYLALIPTALTRFTLTGLRSSSSKFVEFTEQGKLFSLIALCDELTSIIATTIFNGLYPLTLNFFSGTIFLVVAVLCLIPIGLLLNVYFEANLTETERTPLNSPTVTNNDDE
uniref:Proton-coupled folate transporter n=1 Tax=Panagrolaimus davidi TaxID=227884 RepID=A0A914P1T7_9BILA